MSVHCVAGVMEASIAVMELQRMEAAAGSAVEERRKAQAAASAEPEQARSL